MKKGDKVVYIQKMTPRDYELAMQYGLSIPDPDEIYTVEDIKRDELAIVELITNWEVPFLVSAFRKVEPQTNALSKELASKVMWEEKVKHPGLQEKELNPKVFSLTEKF